MNGFVTSRKTPKALGNPHTSPSTKNAATSYSMLVRVMETKTSTRTKDHAPNPLSTGASDDSFRGTMFSCERCISCEWIVESSMLSVCLDMVAGDRV